MINKHKSNKIKENSNTVRHLNNGTDHRHSKSCCDQSSPARRTISEFHYLYSIAFNVTGIAHNINQWIVFANYAFKIGATFPRGQCVNWCGWCWSQVPVAWPMHIHQTRLVNGVLMESHLENWLDVIGAQLKVNLWLTKWPMSVDKSLH